ncbi:MAG: hypothetical protein ACLPLZ_14850 [Terracidiphilus sp.]
MRRGFSIFLVLFFGLGPLSAFVDSSADAGLPACCRRHGAHHCVLYAQIMAMRAGRGIDPTPGFSAPLTCPLYHGPTFSMLMPAHALAAASANLRAEFTRTPAPRFERMAGFSGPSRAHAGRGPPASDRC